MSAFDADADSDEDDGGIWSCEVCDFKNTGGSCDMCGTSKQRSSSSALSAAAAATKELEDEGAKLDDMLAGLKVLEGEALTVMQKLEDAKADEAEKKARLNKETENLKKAMSKSKLPAGDPVLLRTDFSDDEVWGTIVAAATRPSSDGFSANVQPVDDACWAALTAQDVRDLHEGESERVVAFVVDAITVADPTHPILCICLEGKKLKTLRAIPTALWSVENNLSAGNMDWTDFTGALDSTGVFCGF